MEVAQDSGQAAHMVGVRVAEGDRVEVADAARPKGLRDDLFADIEFLRGLAWTAPETAAIDKEGPSVGGDQEEGVALADVNSFHKEGVGWVIDWPGGDGG